ncbi:MAG: hypothetical protein ACON5H_04935 [Akkermansiaceae bacterium]
MNFVRIPAIFFSFGLAGFGQDIPPRNPVPEAVKIEAQKAVQALANQVVRGNQDAAFKHMNPEWKVKLARKNGGEKKLMKDMRDQFARLQAQGVVIRAMEAKVPTTAYEVDFGVVKKVINGRVENAPIYKKWLVFVPTVSLVSATNRRAQPPETYDLRIDGFQAAICAKGKNDWTFIDGADLKAANLRELFKFLPKNEKKLGFPKREKKFLESR